MFCAIDLRLAVLGVPHLLPRQPLLLGGHHRRGQDEGQRGREGQGQGEPGAQSRGVERRQPAAQAGRKATATPAPAVEREPVQTRPGTEIRRPRRQEGRAAEEVGRPVASALSTRGASCSPARRSPAASSGRPRSLNQRYKDRRGGSGTAAGRPAS